MANQPATTARTAESGDPALNLFSEPVRGWFTDALGAPTDIQELAWPRIAAGEHTLICAPTGSGKTLAAFLAGIDSLARRATSPDTHEASGEKLRGHIPHKPSPLDGSGSVVGDRLFGSGLGQGVKVLYVSPLKALSYDVDRNLRLPLDGIAALDPAAAAISVGLRTGDTPQSERQAMKRRPPDILITTPESLYLMLTSQVREILTGVETVIIDEIHAVAQSKRGAHMALTLERLSHLVTAAGNPDPQRIGLSATQRPLERIGEFLVGPSREVSLADTGQRKPLDLKIRVPVFDDAASHPRTRSGGGGEPDREGRALSGQAVWPQMYPELLDLVHRHTSTIIFVNNRRTAERLAGRLNDLNINSDSPGLELPATEHHHPTESTADPAEHDPLQLQPGEIARAHHGSLAHEERTVVEEMLKSGRLPCIVATSSLELGIDMGAVDLVIQVESPKSVSRGLQRIGRAGHTFGETAKGRIFPKFRADLLECAVVARRMREGEIEETILPSNPLDVLAQQIVAITAESEWTVDELETLVKRTSTYEDLGREQLENVLDMLDGRYPSERFADLRPRVAWNREEGTVRGRKGARQLAITNAGTIPDRGLYGVHLPDGRRVGELDEEMVYEARAGQTFLLGATTWRIEEITRDRVIVSPAPGTPGAVPFWKGDSIGRPAELGEAIGAFCREAVDAEPADLEEEYHLEPQAAINLVTYLRDQQEATRVVPSDKTIVVERFRDEIGDWRLCILSPWGGRVHSAWGLALTRRLRDELGLEAQAIFSDDGIIIHLPDADTPPPAEMALIDPEDVEDLIVAELAGSALFGSRFRENAARSLLLPRAYPGRRTPLWQQRLKAQNLLEVAREFPRFPVMLETFRECLQDVLDLDALRKLLGDLRSRKVGLVEAETASASPFATSLLFDYVATYMYEGDTPTAERRAAALALDRELLRELLGQEELRELIDPDAVLEVELSLQQLTDHGLASDRDALQQTLRRLGDLTAAECAARVSEGYSVTSMLERLASERRAVEVDVGGEKRWIAVEDAGMFSGALGVEMPAGLPEDVLAEPPEPLLALARRWVRTHGPFPASRFGDRYGIDPLPVLQRLEADGELVRGEILPGGSGHEWCEPDVLRRIRRASLATLRAEVEAVDVAELARFQISWQNVDTQALSGASAGPDRLRAALIPLQGITLTPETWERDVLPRRLGAYSPAWIDQLTTGGEVVWIGEGALGSTGRVGLYFREDVRLIGPTADPNRRPKGPLHAQIRDLLASGPRFWIDIVGGVGLEPGVDPAELHTALWDLVWAGEVTNDSFAPLRSPGNLPAAGAQARRPAGRRFASSRVGTGAVPGRWSLVAPLLEGAPPQGPRLRARAELMLERYGLVTRETAIAEGVPGGFSTLYGELANLELLGVARRGYFVAGLGGAQFALPAAIERLRSQAPADDALDGLVVLAATDPANAYGATVPWPRRAEAGGRRPSRTPGAFLVLRRGRPEIYVERGGRGLLMLTDVSDERLVSAAAALVEAVTAGKVPRMAVERVEGEPVVGSRYEQLLIDAGFRRQPRRLVASR